MSTPRRPQNGRTTQTQPPVPDSREANAPLICEFSPTTLALFWDLLGRTHLNAAADDFEVWAGAVAIARVELSRVMPKPVPLAPS